MTFTQLWPGGGSAQAAAFDALCRLYDARPRVIEQSGVKLPAIICRRTSSKPCWMASTRSGGSVCFE
jgi:hypothetical protein